MGLSKEQVRCAEIMCRYNMSKDDMKELMQLAVDAGIEMCLQEQERIRKDQDSLIAKAYVGPGLVH